MTEMILHHYELSTFSEKMRVAFGLKNLAWRSVETLPAPPRPLLAPLTGGYRRIPVLQVGADILRHEYHTAGARAAASGAYLLS
jgi:glutathione S-transferase